VVNRPSNCPDLALLVGTSSAAPVEAAVWGLVTFAVVRARVPAASGARASLCAVDLQRMT
jgi:hypothetical protein